MPSLQDWHWEMWNAIAENNYSTKEDWEGWNLPEVQELANNNEYIETFKCFACAIRSTIENEYYCGAVCPIRDWGNFKAYEVIPCIRSKAYFKQWRHCITREERKHLAIAIADAWED